MVIKVCMTLGVRSRSLHLTRITEISKKLCKSRVSKRFICRHAYSVLEKHCQLGGSHCCENESAVTLEWKASGRNVRRHCENKTTKMWQWTCERRRKFDSLGFDALENAWRHYTPPQKKGGIRVHSLLRMVKDETMNSILGVFFWQTIRAQFNTMKFWK